MDKNGVYKAGSERCENEMPERQRGSLAYSEHIINMGPDAKAARESRDLTQCKLHSDMQVGR